MSRASDLATRRAAAEAAVQAVVAEAEALKWVSTSGIASATLMPNGDLDLRGGFIGPSDALALGRFLADNFDEPRAIR